MRSSDETERYRVIIERAGKDDMISEIKSNPPEVHGMINEVIAGLMHCDVTAYRLDEDGERVGEPIYEERIEDPYKEEREVANFNLPY